MMSGRARARVRFGKDETMKTTRLLSLALSAGLIAGAAAFQAGCDDEPFEIVDIDVPPDRPGFTGITNGTATNWEIWRGVVAVYTTMGQYGSLCTGTLIDPQVVLTAGHCVYYPSDGLNSLNNPGSVQILGGANINTGAYLLSDVSAVVKHPQWNGTLDGGTDLALIKTSSAITMVPYYGVRSGNYPSVGSSGVIVGYGNNTTGSGSGVHRWGNTTLLEVYSNLIELGSPSGTCQGDSGGPLFTDVGGQYVVTGVTSFGDSYTCDPNQGSWSVTVQTYRPWIEDQVIAWTGHGLGGGSTDADADSDADADADADADSDADNDNDVDGDADGDDDDDDENDEDGAFGLDDPNPLQSCQAAAAKAPTAGLVSLAAGLL
jgi:V8-like Glu-specific endopeptidase